MIGKMRDMVTAAVVVSAADNKGAISSSAKTAKVQSDESTLTTQTNVQPEETEVVAAATDVAQSDQEEQVQEGQQDKPQLSDTFVSEMTRELNELMSKLNCDLEFQYHKEVGVMSVKMVDKNTKEVIKEYPPEEMVEGMIRAQEWLGAFLDKNA